MDETAQKLSPSEDEDSNKIPESPKPLAFTIDFGEGKAVDTQRYKTLVEKYQSRHKRGQSLSKFEESPTQTAKKHPSTGNLPRKSSFHSEGYFSSDEKVDKFKFGARSSVLNTVISKGDLTLPLRNVTSDRMTQSFPGRNFDLPSIDSPEIELKDVSSPELELISPLTPNDAQSSKLELSPTCVVNSCRLQKLTKQLSSPECESRKILTPSKSNESDGFVCGTDYDFEKSDTVSDAGTYTIEGDNYTEEQKARMSIDKYFNIEQVSDIKKAQEYIQSLNISQPIKPAQKCESPTSPVAQIPAQKPQNNSETRMTKKIFNKILYPTVRSHNIEPEPEKNVDLGVFTSITASGVLSKRPEKRGHVRRSSLVQSEIFVEAYTGDTSIKQPYENVKIIQTVSSSVLLPKTEASQEVQRIRDVQKRRSLNLEEMMKGDVESLLQNVPRVTNLPPAIGGISGKNSPSKIPSPVHTINRPRSRNSLSSQNLDLSDSSLETESYLKPTQNIISSLQARLSLDSDQDSDYDRNYVALNNETKNLLKNKPMHVRYNSFDDHNVKISNKLEHFHNKNLQGIDQTLKTCNQYTKQVHRIQNSPNNSPIRRSSSFSLKNQFETQQKCLNTGPINKDTNVAYNSPSFQRNGTVQRSASTANIKPNLEIRRSSISSDHKKYLDTESSSEDDYEKSTTSKTKKDLTNTRYNRAFSLRRARLDEPSPPPRCPNTPEMRRKFPAEKSERTVSVDRKSAKAQEVQSRYMNISKSAKAPPKPQEAPKSAKPPSKMATTKPQVFSRTDTGRFSMRTQKPVTSAPKPLRREQQSKKQSGPRSNSTLSSREVEFQNWKRRKSYDPMKAAAEGKRKAELARKQQSSTMTQSFNENECDSSPSHSSSVHRSQSFHGTAALEQLISSEEDDDLTLSGDEGFSPPTPSPCEMSPSKSNLRHIWMDRFPTKR